MELELLSPMHGQTTDRRVLAAGLRSLEGAVISTLHNGKWNADHLVADVLDVLVQEHGVRAGLRRGKDQYNVDMDAELRTELTTTSDAVLLAVGD